MRTFDKSWSSEQETEDRRKVRVENDSYFSSIFGVCGFSLTSCIMLDLEEMSTTQLL